MYYLWGLVSDRVCVLCSAAPRGRRGDRPPEGGPRRWRADEEEEELVCRLASQAAVSLLSSRLPLGQLPEEAHPHPHRSVASPLTYSPSHPHLSPWPLTFTSHLSPSPLTSHLHLSPSPLTFTSHLSPLTFTSHLHLSPLTFTSHLHLSSSPLTFTSHLPPLTSSPLTSSPLVLDVCPTTVYNIVGRVTSTTRQLLCFSHPIMPFIHIFELIGHIILMGIVASHVKNPRFDHYYHHLRWSTFALTCVDLRRPDPFQARSRSSARSARSRSRPSLTASVTWCASTALTFTTRRRASWWTGPTSVTSASSAPSRSPVSRGLDAQSGGTLSALSFQSVLRAALWGKLFRNAWNNIPGQLLHGLTGFKRQILNSI